MTDQQPDKSPSSDPEPEALTDGATNATPSGPAGADEPIRDKQRRRQGDAWTGSGSIG
jgi:hypothetical protein